MHAQVSVPKQEEKKERSNWAFTAHRNHGTFFVPLTNLGMLKSRIYEDNQLKKKMQEGAHKIFEENKTTPFFN